MIWRDPFSGGGCCSCCSVPQLNALWAGGGAGVTWYYTIVHYWYFSWGDRIDVTLLVVVAVVVVAFPSWTLCVCGGGGVTWYYTVVCYWCFSWGNRIADVVAFYYPTTWAATYRLQRVSLRSWRMDAVKQGCLLWVKIVSGWLRSSRIVLVYVHRDSTDCQGQGAQDGHLDLHTAPELQSMQEITF